MEEVPLLGDCVGKKETGQAERKSIWKGLQAWFSDKRRRREAKRRGYKLLVE